MDSKITQKLFALATTAIAMTLLSACSPGPSDTEKDTHLIGTPIEKVSTMSKQDGTDSESTYIFDETTRKVHLFELSTMNYIKSFSVRNPDLKHVVLAHEQGNYLIDFCEKMVTIYSKNGQVYQDPISFEGKPLSAAFRSDLNLLVMYDDLNTVGIVKMDANGQVVKAWVGGNLLGSANIQAGDLLSNGKLILTLSNKSIAVVDVAQTLAQESWIFTTFPSGVADDISWVAPVRGNADEIFVRSKNEVAIFNVVTQSKVASTTLSESIVKFSKLVDGHITTASTGGTRTIYYAESSQIKARSLNNQYDFLMVSYLNIAQNTWKFIDSSYKYDAFYYNDADYVRENRTLKSYRLSDMLAQKKTAIENKSQALISNSFIFHLFPSEMGYATRVNIMTGEKKEAKYFNLGHINP